MRCKNCGAENDDSRYICEVCGSPYMMKMS